VSNTNRIYDINTNTWTIGAPLPTGLTDHATAYWDGKIYVVAGYNGSVPVNTLYIYDIASDSWTTGACMPAALFLPGFGIINGKLYIASGSNGVFEVNTLYIYDIATNTWTTGPNVPTPVSGPGSAVYQGKLYLFGGAAGFPILITATQIFDPVANSWSTGPSMNVARIWFYGGNIDDSSIVAPGGDNPVGFPINVNEQLTVSWAVRAPLPYNARGPFAVSDGTFVYIGGGWDGSIVRTDTLRYDPVANSYTTLAPAPDPHYLSQAVIVTNPCPTPTPTPTATATPTPTPGQITLRAEGRKVNGVDTVLLNWRGATSSQVDIYRCVQHLHGCNPAVIATTANVGSYIDSTGHSGPADVRYRVCEAGTPTCSKTAGVIFRH